VPSISPKAKPRAETAPPPASKPAPGAAGPFSSPSQKWLLRAAVLIGGAAVMVVEILGSRMLAPTFGTTHHVWSALITVALIGLAVGYAVGGRVADRRPGLGMLMTVMAVATGTLLLADLLTKPVLRAAYGAGMIGGTFIAALALLLPTLFLLGMVSPMAVRAAADQRHLGKSVGNLYALSTIGSVAGSLAVSLILIPYYSVHTAIAVTAVALGLAPVVYFALGAGRQAAALLAVALTLGVVYTKVAGEDADRELYYKGEAHPVTARIPSAYGDLVVSDYKATRFLFLNGVTQGSLRGNLSGSLYAYGLERLVTAKGVPRSVLIWGLGAGIVARALAEAGSYVTVIEIDPASERIARDYFGLPGAVKVIIGDARTETLGLSEKYDVIILDAFSGDSPPFHLLTREAFASLRERLAPGGLVVANIVGGTAGEEARAVASVARTLEDVFGRVEAFAPNKYLFGRDQPDYVSTVFLVAGELPAAPAPLTLPIPEERRAYVDSVFASRVTLPRDRAIVLTDAYAPLDAWSDSAVRAMRY